MTSVGRKRITAFAVLASLAAGCGGEAGDNDTASVGGSVAENTTTTGRDEATTTEAESEAAMADVVVQLDDLPSGWTVQPPDEDDDDDSDLCGTGAGDPLEAIEAVDEANSGFGQSEFGPIVLSGASRLDSEEVAEGGIDQVQALFDDCESFTEVDDEGQETVYAVSEMSFPDLGDDSSGYRMTANSLLGPIAIDFAFVREGEVVLVVAQVAFGATDPSLTEQLIRTMLDRL